MATTDATTLLLIRHAHTDAIGHWLAGRSPGVLLSAAGRRQADRLGRSLGAISLAAVHTSPLERALETAHALARYQPAPVHIDEELVEIDFGDWTGKTFRELESSSEFRLFNAHRSRARIPGGEPASDAQRRIVAALTRLAEGHPGETIAIVSHGDVLRFAVAHYTATPLDLFHRFEISPASVTGLSLSTDGARLLYVNRASYTEPATGAEPHGMARK